MKVTKAYNAFMDRAIDLRICCVCSEEHSGHEIPDKPYERTDPLFSVLVRPPLAGPVLAFSSDLVADAGLVLRVCHRCLKDLKKGHRTAPHRITSHAIQDPPHRVAS
jgi:hypothetical protein